MRLVLASSSPRRAELLRSLGLEFEVRPPWLDETRWPEESPSAHVERLARDKALSQLGTHEVVLGVDTVVVQGGQMLGKPVHPEEARSMLRRLAGRRHEVVTGLAVAKIDEGSVVHSAIDTTEVSFLPMTDEEIEDYVNTGEPMDKAGAYALQGSGGIFVEAIKGSPYTVIGLPIHLLPRLLSRVGLHMGQFRREG